MKNVGNSSDGRSQGVPKISGHPCIGGMGALRGHLCDSTAFLFTQAPLTGTRSAQVPVASEDYYGVALSCARHRSTYSSMTRRSMCQTFCRYGRRIA